MEAFKDILWLYPKVNCIVYDRACHMMPAAKEDTDLNQITHYVVDRFHALRHGPKCNCNPRSLELISCFHFYKKYALLV